MAAFGLRLLWRDGNRVLCTHVTSARGADHLGSDWAPTGPSVSCRRISRVHPTSDEGSGTADELREARLAQVESQIELMEPPPGRPGGPEGGIRGLPASDRPGD